jgi:hypothetical protein
MRDGTRALSAVPPIVVGLKGCGNSAGAFGAFLRPGDSLARTSYALVSTVSESGGSIKVIGFVNPWQHAHRKESRL